MVSNGASPQGLSTPSPPSPASFSAAIAKNARVGAQANQGELRSLQQILGFLDLRLREMRVCQSQSTVIPHRLVPLQTVRFVITAPIHPALFDIATKTSTSPCHMTRNIHGDLSGGLLVPEGLSARVVFLQNRLR